MKLSKAFDMYQKDYIEFTNQSKRTLELHLYVRKNLLQNWGDVELSQISVRMVTSWKYELEKTRSANTTRLYIIRLRDVLGYCSKRHIACLDIDLIPPPRRREVVPVFLSAKEVAMMIDAATNPRAKFIISLLYASGLRLSEMLSLDRGQITERRFTVIGKGGKPRLCFIDERTERLMNEYLATRNDTCTALIVTFETKRRILPTNVQAIVRTAAKNAGILKKVTPHTLRHSYATNFLKNNGNIRYLSQSLGHASLDTTAHYAHVVDADLESQYRKYHTI